MKKEPMVGVGVIIIKDNKVLLGKRKGSHGEGAWAPPGGHLEFNEDIEDCAKREVLEEIGIHIKDVSFVIATNDIFKEENRHHITLWMVSCYDYGGLKKYSEIEKWEWFEWNNLPEPLFIPVQNLLKFNYDPFK